MMMPCNGSGYDHSMYWRSKMKEIAKENDEECPCWHNGEPNIKFIGDIEEFTIEIKCHNACLNSFQLTQMQFLNQFKNFYKA